MHKQHPAASISRITTAAVAAVHCLYAHVGTSSLLYRSGAQNLPPVSFKEFSDEKASTKVKKAAASSKGFGASAAKAASTAAAVTTELSGEQLEAILNCNAYGDDHLDGGLTSCRQEQQASIIGK